MKNKIPAFIAYKGWEKNEFLDSIGFTKTHEVRLFSLLCTYVLKVGRPEISTGEFLAVVQAWAKQNNETAMIGLNARNALVLLLKKLEEGHFTTLERNNSGISRFTLVEGQATTAVDNKTAAAINKEFEAVEYDLNRAYPSRSRFEIPDEQILRVSYKDFSKINLSKYSQLDRPVVITFSEKVDLIVMPEKMGDLLELPRKKIHFFLLRNKDLFDFVYIELRKILPAKKTFSQTRFFEYLEGQTEAEPAFWVYLAIVIFKSKEKASQMKKMSVGNLSIYQSAYLLHSYWQHELAVVKKTQSVEADERQILSVMRGNPKFFSLQDLHGIKDKNGKLISEKNENFNDFLKSFLDRYKTKKDDDTKLPLIIEIEKHFIHKDSLCNSFFDMLTRESSLCERYFHDRWEGQIKEGVFSNPAMHDDDSFNKEISTQIRADLPFLDAFLSNPALIYASIDERVAADKSLAQRQQFLFMPGPEPRFREVKRLLSLDRETILKNITSDLSFFQQLFLKLKLKVKGAEKPGTAGTQKIEKPARGSAGRNKAARKKGHSKNQRASLRQEKGRQKGPPASRKERKPVAQVRQQDPKKMDKALEELRKAMVQKPK